MVGRIEVDVVLLHVGVEIIRSQHLGDLHQLVQVVIAVEKRLLYAQTVEGWRTRDDEPAGQQLLTCRLFAVGVRKSRASPFSM